MNAAARSTRSSTMSAATPTAWIPSESTDDSTRLRVGSFCSIAGDIDVLLGGNHRTDWMTTYPFGHIFQGEFPSGAVNGIAGHPSSKGDIEIENDIWIGQGALLLSGSRVANGCVVAARSVVTGTTQPFGIYAGSPARLVRMRFDEQTVSALLRSRWWDWPDEQIDRIVPLLQSTPTRETLDRLLSAARDVGVDTETA